MSEFPDLNGDFLRHAKSYLSGEIKFVIDGSDSITSEGRIISGRF